MSTMTTTYPVTDLVADLAPLPSSTPGRPWGFWSTLGWFVLALVVACLCLIPLGLAYLAGLKLTGLESSQTINESLGCAALSILAALVLMLAAHRTGWSAFRYVGLVWPHRRYIAIGFAVLACEVVFDIGLDYLLPSSGNLPTANEYPALIGNPVALVLFWLSTVVVAPVTEEIVFRGFIMRGWLETRLAAVGSIVLVSLLFAAVHVPSEVSGFISLFVGGMLLATVRWLSGSIVPTILMHATWNFGLCVMIALGM